jgi:hypothetical protein
VLSSGDCRILVVELSERQKRNQTPSAPGAAEVLLASTSDAAKEEMAATAPFQAEARAANAPKPDDPNGEIP